MLKIGVKVVRWWITYRNGPIERLTSGRAHGQKPRQARRTGGAGRRTQLCRSRRHSDEYVRLSEPHRNCARAAPPHPTHLQRADAFMTF